MNHDHYKQESRADTRKPRDAAAVLLGLKFADDIHYKFKSSHANFELEARLQSSKHTGTNHILFMNPQLHTIVKTEFNAKWRFKVIQSHVFWSQWKGGKVLYNNVGVIC